MTTQQTDPLDERLHAAFIDAGFDEPDASTATQAAMLVIVGDPHGTTDNPDQCAATVTPTEPEFWGTAYRCALEIGHAGPHHATDDRVADWTDPEGGAE